MPNTVWYFASIVLTGALCAFLAAYAWRQRRVPGSRAYAALALGECGLALAELLSLLSPTPAQALFWFQVRFPFLAVIPIFWLAFALDYSGRRHWLSKPLWAGLFIVPTLTQAMLWSNRWLGLWVKQDVGFHQIGPFWLAELGARLPGLGFLAHSLYSMILLLLGTRLLLVTAWRMRRQYLGQALLLALAGFTAFVFAINAVFNLTPQLQFNLFTPGLGLSVLLVALASFRFEFLRRAPAAGADAVASAPNVQSQRSLAVFVLLFVVLAAGLAAIGYVSYQDYEQQFRRQVESGLSGVATLKVEELQDWRQERLADAQLLHQNPALATLVQRVLSPAAPGDASAQTELQAWLARYQVYGQYDQVFLLDTDGVLRLSGSGAPQAELAPEPVAAHLAQSVPAVLAAGQVNLLDFHRDTSDGAIHLALLVPIFAEQDGNRPLGVIVLRIDPYAYLYPFLQRWPNPSQTGETLLVRREGADALYLNELRFQANTALNLRVPLEHAQLPSVKAALGQEGIVEGLDYRGVPVMADVRAVPGSPWFLVAKMDAAEAYAPLRERLWETVVFFGALLAAAGTALGFVWRQQSARYERAQVEAAQALRESEERYRVLVEASPEAITLADLEGKLIFANPQAAVLHGFASPQEMIGVAILDLIAPDSRPKAVATWRHILEVGLVREADGWLLRRDGAGFPAEITSAVIRDGRGGPVAVLGITRDVTARTKMEEQLRQAQKMEVVGRLAGGVAHDFNNLLTGILGYSDLVLRSLSPEDPRRQDVEEIQKAGERAAALTRQLLAFSRKQILQPQLLDANDLLRNLAKMLQRLVGDDVELTLTLERGLSRVRADPGQLEQVVLNLAVNARDAMPQGGRLTIQTQAVTLDEDLARPVWADDEVAAGRYVLLAVHDTGLGMDAATQAHLFEPFFTTKDVGQGTGLGLATVYGIVRQSGGRIGVQSAPGQGTTFSVYLPAQPAQEDESSSGHASPGEEPIQTDRSIAPRGRSERPSPARATVPSLDGRPEAARPQDEERPSPARAKPRLADGRPETVWPAQDEERPSPARAKLPAADSPSPARAMLPSSDRRPETVLLVEDETVVRELTCRQLQESGYTVLPAAYGEQALAAAAGHAGPIHLLVTDLVMPGGMSGRQVAERLSSLRPEMKVLYMSGYTDDAVVRHGLQPAVAHFLQKPFSPEELAHQVRQVLEGTS